MLRTKQDLMRLQKKYNAEFLSHDITGEKLGLIIKTNKVIPILEEMIEYRDDAIKNYKPWPIIAVRKGIDTRFKYHYKIYCPISWMDLWGWENEGECFPYMDEKSFYYAWQEAANYDDMEAYVSNIISNSIFDTGEDPKELKNDLSNIWEAYHMSIKKIRKLTHLSQAAFCQKFCIPKRTLKDWETETRKCKDYIRFMILRHLGLINNIE